MEKNKIDFKPDVTMMEDLREETNKVVKSLKRSIKSHKIKADIFLGGSYAKDTLVMKDNYDVDIFIRFDKKNIERDIQKLTQITSKVAKELNSAMKNVHGSRDYYQIIPSGKLIIFEIIPVLKIRKPEESENVTDLSYFHVNFIKKKLNSEKLRRQVRLAKAFCAACDTYGAESYIQGFSGYALECLIVHYKSLDKMLKKLANVDQKMIIDSEKHYKNSKEIMMQLNESKLQSPVIVIDPTWKKRNALASLSRETFERFKKHAKAYLKNKSPNYFELKPVTADDLSANAARYGQQFLSIELTTDKQEGDIAGTKLKKASKYIEQQLRKEFEITDIKFLYDDEKQAELYIIGKPKKEIILSGPPIKMEKHARAFRAEHKNVFEKKGRLYAKKQVSQSLKQYFEDKVARDINLGLMSVTSARIA